MRNRFTHSLVWYILHDKFIFAKGIAYKLNSFSVIKAVFECFNVCIITGVKCLIKKNISLKGQKRE